jgi:hypothetical protein
VSALGQTKFTRPCRPGRVRSRWRQARHMLGLFLRAPDPWFLALGHEQKSIWWNCSCLSLVVPRVRVRRAASVPRCFSALAQDAPKEQRRLPQRPYHVPSQHQCAFTPPGRRKRQLLHCAGPSRPARQQSPTDCQGLWSPGACIHPGRIVVGGPMLAGSLSAPERCGEFLIRCIFFCRASSTMPKSAKVRL